MTSVFRLPNGFRKGILSKIKVKYFLAAICLVFVLDFFGAFTHILEEDYYSSFKYPLDIDLTEVLDALRNGQTPSVQPINRYSYQYIIPNEDKCKKLDDDKAHQDIVLLFLIKSAVSHTKHRDAIRHSWGFEKRFSDVQIRRVFLLGLEVNDKTAQDRIEQESKVHRDIVQANFVDTYYNNTIKTLMGFKWVVTHCPKTQFILLVDDDMYVSAKNLLKFMRNPLGLLMAAPRSKFEASLQEPETSGGSWWELSDSKSDRKPVYDGRLYAGYAFFSSPLRHKYSKWYISLVDYPYSMYPPYVTAGAVSLSYPALLDMYYASFYTKHFKFDDIYMGILARKAGIHPIHNRNVYFWKMAYSPSAYASVVASHGFENPQELIKTWEEQKSLGNA